MSQLPDDSVTVALRAVERTPRSGAAWRTLGAAMLASGRPAAAAEALTQAVRLSPTDADAWTHLGMARRRSRDPFGGLEALQRAVALAPQDAACWGNLSAAMESCGDVEGAAQAALQAARLAPHDPDWLAARGNALRAAGDIPGALAAYDAAAQLAPHDVRIAWNRSLALLCSHDFAHGFPAYEVRRDRPQHTPLPAPEWTSGPPPAGGVVVHHEQGFGDTLQWARFLPILAQRTSRVVVAAPKRLHALLMTIDGVDAVVTREQARAPSALGPLSCAAHVGMLSLGARLRIGRAELAASLPVFQPEAQRLARWKAELQDPRPVVAITWQGNPAYERDHLRSPPLRAFAPVVDRADVRFVSLQKFHGLDQLQGAGAPLHRIEDVGARVDLGESAFVDSAAVMAVADLIITSDTSTAHLAGALGRPTWVVLSRPADWRWGHDPHETPWYPSMRLFRQPRTGDWPSVFKAVAEALETWIQRRTASAPESP